MSLSLDEMLIGVRERLISHTEADRLTIYLVDFERKELYSRFYKGSGIQEIRVKVDDNSIAGYAALHATCVNIANVYDKNELASIDPKIKFNSGYDQKTHYKTTQVMATPVLLKQNVIGVIQLINNKKGHKFRPEDQKSLENINNCMAGVLHKFATQKRTIYDYIIEQSYITRAQTVEAEEFAYKHKLDIQSVLLDKYKISKQALCKSMAEHYGVDFVLYDAKQDFPCELIEGINQKFLANVSCVPISYKNNTITIAIAEPTLQNKSEAKKFIRTKESNCDYEFMIATRKDIGLFIESLYSGKANLKSTDEILGDLEVITEDSIDTGLQDMDENASPIVNLVNKIIMDAYNKGASDIHVDPSKSSGRTMVRYRIDGDCLAAFDYPVEHHNGVISRIKVIAKLDIAEKRLPQSGKIAVRTHGTNKLELRVEIVPTVNSEGAVLRLLAAGEPIPMEKLNFTEWNYNMTKEIISQPHGLFLVVGPTGSGKTTSLHSIISYLNVTSRTIWTAEDPVEITQAGLKQVQMINKIGLNFAAALRSFLRADPDIIMVGEMRDKETASIAVEASVTGHLVLSTLHTNSAPETITRLLGMGIDPLSFSDALLGVAAQRLIRTLCSCKQSYLPDQALFDRVAQVYGEKYFPNNIVYDKNIRFFKPTGCDRCMSTGYKGRTGIHEVLRCTDEIKVFIKEKAPVEKIRASAMGFGSRTLTQDGIMKAFKGDTSLEKLADTVGCNFEVK